MANRLPRKLAAILYADVAGYSRLTGEDEDATHRTLSEYLDLISNTIQSHGGQVMHYAGDAVLARFDAVVDALSAAVAIQNVVDERNRDLPEKRKVQFRIGVNLGDVIEDRGDMYGDGVNVAARLESLADPGGICVSESVRSAIGNKLSLDYEFMGEQSVKNIKESIRAYQARPQSTDPTKTEAPERSELELPDKPSIAVLPFVNMSSEPEQEHFSDGITEDIITALSRISGLLVVARNSTMVYKGKPIDIKQVGSEQGVQYVLEGSVRKGGNRIRVTAQLINATTGHHQWADRYDRELDDIFAVQDDITRNITIEMQVQLTKGEQARLWAGGTDNIDAWGYVTRGWELYERDIREDNQEARHLAEKAVSIDPKYADGWALLGWTHWLDALWGWTDSLDQALTRANEAGHECLDINQDNPHAWALLGQVHLLRSEHEACLSALEKAVALAPNHAENIALLGDALAVMGRPDEAIPKIERGMRLSPVYPSYFAVILGNCYQQKENWELAIGAYRNAVDLGPESPIGAVFLASALVETGRIEEARPLAQQVLRMDPNFYEREKSSWLEKPSQVIRDAGLL